VLDFAKRNLKTLTIIGLVAGIGWMVIPAPKFSEGFPESISENFSMQRSTVVSEHAPDANYFCLIGGYDNVAEFLESKGIKSDIDIYVGESDFVIVLEKFDASLEYAYYSRSDLSTSSVATGCYRTELNRIEFNKPKWGNEGLYDLSVVSYRGGDT